MVRVDAVEAERALRDVEAEDREASARRLRSALDLWRGRPYADVGLEALEPEVNRLEELRLQLAEKLYALELELGRHGEVVPELARLVDAAPIREGLRAQLMTALWRTGRRAEALACFRDARQTTIEELGVEPGTVLRRLHQQILTEPEPDPSSGTATEAVGSGRPDVPSELPRASPTFSGRVRELDRLVDPAPARRRAFRGGGGLRSGRYRQVRARRPVRAPRRRRLPGRTDLRRPVRLHASRPTGRTAGRAGADDALARGGRAVRAGRSGRGVGPVPVADRGAPAADRARQRPRCGPGRAVDPGQRDLPGDHHRPPAAGRSGRRDASAGGRAGRVRGAGHAGEPDRSGPVGSRRRGRRVALVRWPPAGPLDRGRAAQLPTGLDVTGPGRPAPRRGPAAG